MNILAWIISLFPDTKTVPNQPLPVGVLYGVVLGDTCGLSRPSHNELHEAHVPLCSKLPPYYGLPATVKLKNSKVMRLNRKWQLYWYGLLRMSAPNMSEKDLKKAWAQLTAGNRCYTNGQGSEDHADYINGTNLDKPAIGKETILTQGAIVAILEHGKLYSKRGELCYKIAMLDGTKNPPPLPANASISPWTHYATISRRQLDQAPNGQWYGREDMVIRFPQLGGDDVPVPNMGNGPFDFIPANRVRVLKADEDWPEPYNW